MRPRVDVVTRVPFKLLDSVVQNAKRLCVGESCCLEHRRKPYSCSIRLITEQTTLCLSICISLLQLVTLELRLLCELALVIPRCNTDQFTRLFLPVAVRLWKFLLPGLLSGGTLNSF